jgi:HrpA-like RNA helicase
MSDLVFFFTNILLLFAVRQNPAKPERNYLEAAIRTTMQIHQHEGPGDILLFLTGELEIENFCQDLRDQAAALEGDYPEMVVYPLYSSLPPQQQKKIFDPAPLPRVVGGPPGRKVIVSTNIAETSLTIDGIVYVVDPGKKPTKTAWFSLSHRQWSHPMFLYYYQVSQSKRFTILVFA